MKKLKKNLMIGITAAATAMTSAGCARVDSSLSSRAQSFFRNVSKQVSENRFRPEDNKNQDVYGPPSPAKDGADGSYEIELVAETEFGVIFDESIVERSPQLLYGPPSIFSETELPESSEIQSESGADEKPSGETPSEEQAEKPSQTVESESGSGQSESPAPSNESGNVADDPVQQTETAVFEAPQLLYGPPPAVSDGIDEVDSSNDDDKEEEFLYAQDSDEKTETERTELK